MATKFGTFLLAAAVALGGIHARAADELPDDLTAFSLEALSQIKVTSVSKKEQDLRKSAAAVYVITGEDLRRSGATTIPEALRMVPGFQVGRINESFWAVSSRGFNDTWAGQLLVLLDGRTLYTPLFSGVYWDMQDVMLEDIDRIEVIRGPGAVMWGSNAVNGVVNIITKKAEATQGGLATATGGNQDRTITAARYGSKIGDNISYRVYGKYAERQHEPAIERDPGGEGWQAARGGFRLDWDGTGKDSATIQGDLFHSDARQHQTLATIRPPFFQSAESHRQEAGGNLLGRWVHETSDTSGWSVQAYYDHAHRHEYTTGEERHTADFDFQRRDSLSDRSELIWGGGYRFTTDEIIGTFNVDFQPSSQDIHLANGFVQHDWTAVRDRLVLTTGLRFESHTYAKAIWQPNVRLMWTPGRRHAAWASIARAVRAPSRSNRSIIIRFAAFPGQRMFNVLAITGNPSFKPETVVSYDAGYRYEPRKDLSFDVAAFYGDYGDLQDFDSPAPYVEVLGMHPHLLIPRRFANNATAETYGVEVSANYQPVKQWRLTGSYTGFELQAHAEPGSAPANAEALEGADPAHQFQLRSYLNLPGGLELDKSISYVGRLLEGPIPAYMRVDVRLGWRPASRWEISVVGKNLLDGRHPEFPGTGNGFSLTEIRRSVAAKLTKRF